MYSWDSSVSRVNYLQAEPFGNWFRFHVEVLLSPSPYLRIQTICPTRLSIGKWGRRTRKCQLISSKCQFEDDSFSSLKVKGADSSEKFVIICQNTLCHSPESLFLLSTFVNASYRKDLLLNKKFFYLLLQLLFRTKFQETIMFQVEHRFQ
jgi:hypothetical protein